MTFLLAFPFVILMIVSAFMQAADDPAKKVVSPALTGVCGLLVLIGSLLGKIPNLPGLVLFIALTLLAMSDFMFERSAAKSSLFPMAMALGVLSGLTIGILINLLAFSQGIPPYTLGGFAGFALLATAYVYRYLKVEPALKTPVFVYLVQAVVLLTGGLSSLFVGNLPLGIWGIFIFLSDTLVGIRAFPNPQKPIARLDAKRILFSIIVLYYSAQYALVAWAL